MSDSHLPERAYEVQANCEGDGHDMAYTLVRHELEEQGHRLHERDLLDCTHQFRVSLLGGKWQLERTGGERSTYGLRVDIINSIDMDTFVRRFGLTRSGSYEFNVFGQTGSEAMTQLFTRRYTFLFEQWHSAERPNAYPVSLPNMEVSEAMLLPPRELPQRGRLRVDKLLRVTPQ
eukprot:923017-Amphidinium_carterae.4